MATRLSVRAFTVISLLVFITAAAAEQPSPAPTGPQPVGTTVYSLHESGTLVSVTGGVSTGLVDFGGCSATCLDMARDASGNFVVARGSSLAILNPGGNLIRSIAAPEGANYFSVAVDSQGSYIVADTGTRRLLRIAPGPPNTSVSMGTWTLPEGSVSENAYVRIDRAGNYILMVDDQDVNDDPPSLRVFLRTASGPLTSLAITGDAQPISTGGLTFDANGNYVDIDWWGHTVFTITPAGAATVLYSNPNGYLLSPRGITRDPASGDFFLADDDLDAIYTLTPNGLVLNVIAQFGDLGVPGAVIVADTVPRNAIDYVLTDSDPAQIVPVGGGAPLSCSPCSGFPSDFAIDAKGNFIVASDGALVKITPGGGACPTGCTILTPVNGQNFFSVAIDGAGNYVVGDNFNHQILKVAPGSPGTITGAIPYTVNEFEGDAYEDVYVRIDAAGNYVVVEDNDEDNPISIFVIPPTATSSPSPLTLTPGLPLTSIPTTFLGGMTFDATGRYVITDYNSGQVYVVSQAGAFNVLYNSGSTFDALLGIYLDPISGNFLLTDYFSGGLYTMDQAATQVTLVQSGLQNPVVAFSYPTVLTVISSTTLPGGAANRFYSAALMAQGGSGNYTWQATGLPSTLSMSPAGVINGTPTATLSSANIVVTVTDTSSHATAMKTFSLTIGLGASTTTVTSSANRSLLGQPIIFTVTVTPSTATGSIAITEGTTSYCRGSISTTGSTATATCTVGSLSVGAHAITAVYAGDANDLPSTSSVLTQNVTPITPGVAIISSANPSAVGQSVTLIAAMTPLTATGTVTFKDGSTTLGTGNISSAGTATLVVAPGFSFAAHSLTASYSGDTNDLAATSAVLSQVVDQPSLPTTEFFALGPDPSNLGQSVLLTAFTSPAAATGNVTFYDGVNVLGTVATTGGQATLTTSLLPFGAHPIKTHFGLGATYEANTSEAPTQTVHALTASGFAAANSTAASGGGYAVAVADFNGDGKADFAAPANGGVQVALGNGDGTFHDPVLYSTGGNPLFVATGDFDGDGKTDLVVPNRGSTTVSVLLGNGDGTFQAAVGYAAGGDVFSVAVADFNGDGKADLAVSNNQNGTVSVLLGNGDGTFQPAAGYVGAPEGSLWSVVPGDFNGDGKVDLVLGGAGGVTVLPGNGDGTFQAPLSSPDSGRFPLFFAVGDFNGDGKMDVAASANLNFASVIHVLLGKGDGTFQSPVSYDVGSQIFEPGSYGSLVTGDFNGDGKFDLAVPNPGSDNVSVLLGNGDGTFQAAVNYSVGAVPQAIGVGEFNGDYRTDLIVNGSSNFSVLPGIPTGLTPTRTELTSSGSPSTYGQAVQFTATVSPAAATGTVTFYDGTTVLCSAIPITLSGVTANAVCGNITTLAAGGHSISAVYSGDQRYESSSYSELVQFVNLVPPSIFSLMPSSARSGGPGFTLAVTGTNFVSGATIYWSGTALSTTFVSAMQLTAMVTAAQIASGRPVSVTVMNPDTGTSNAPTFTVNTSIGSTTTLLSSASPAVFGQAVTLTANVAQLTRVAVAAPTGKVTFYEGTSVLGIGGLTEGVAHITTGMLPIGSGLLKAYYSGDTSYVPSASATLLQTVHANPSGTLTAAAGSPITVGMFPVSSAVGDFNGDGIQDVAIANDGINGSNLTILLGNGAGGFSVATGSPIAVGSADSVAVGDFNGDGIQDLASANFGNNNVTVLLGNGTGGFSAAPGSPFAVGTNPFSVAVGDFNGDGVSDLAAANATSNNVTVLLGNGAGGFNAAAGSPFAVGTNPRSLAVGDFNGDGASDLAVANIDSNNLTILLGNGAGGFSAATGSPVAIGTNSWSVVVGDFNRDGIPDLAAANFGSNDVTVLLGNGSGSFSAASGSPFTVGTGPRSVAVGDFNGDGIQDFAVANLGSNDVTVLLGNGSGSFSPASDSPFAVGDSYAVAVGDFNGDGKPDLAATNYGDGNIAILLGTSAPTSSLLSTTSPAIVPFGTAISLILAVSDSGTAFNAPTGTVTFSDGATALGMAAQSVSPYTFSATGLTAGSHSFTASYGGDSRTASSVSNSIVITVAASPIQPLSVTSGVPPNGTVNVGYSAFTFIAAGGSGGYLWSASGVPGLSVNGGSGVLSGTPTAPGNFTLAVTLTDAANPASSSSQNYSVTILAAGLTITTSSLPSGIQNQPYAASLAGGGGSGSYAWAISGISGLTVNASTGAISGSPIAGGNITLNVTLSDALNPSAAPATRQLAVRISFAPLTITTPGALGEFAPNAATAKTFTATGGSPVFTWSASGMPATLMLNPTTGQITGNAPAKPGNYSFPLKVSDTQTPVASDSTTVTFSVLGITTPTTLPLGTTSTSYSLNFIAAGGTPPYTFSSAGVPAGLTLLNSGFLNGTPTKPGTSSFQVLVTDARGITPVAGTFSLTVATGVQPIEITGAALPDGTLTTSYSQPLEAQNGKPAYNWTVLGGALPPGLVLSSAGTISGTPTASGTATFTARATDSAGGFASGVFSINVNPAALQISAAALPSAMAGLPYGAQPINATGGFPPYTFALTQGSLPSPLTFGNGQINSGLPAAVGSSNFTVTVTDGAGNTASGAFTLLVEPTHPDLILSQGSVSFSLVTGAVALPTAANVTVGSSVGSSLGYNVTVNPPAPWLDVTSDGSTPGTLGIGLDAANALPLGIGIYQTTVTVSCPPFGGCSGTHDIAVSLTVMARAPQLSLGTNLLSFSATGNSGNGSQALAQSLNLQNSGGGVVTIQSVSAADSWVKFDPATTPPAPLAASQTLPVNVFADTTVLSGPGYYQSTITVTSDAGTATVPVTLLIAANGTMTLAPAGSQFNTVAGNAPGNSNGSFFANVSGNSTVNWTASIQPTALAASWLTLNTPSGSSTSANPGVVSFSINGSVAGLAAGARYATIEITATGGGVTDPVQDYQVVLNIAPAGNIAAPNPDPSGLIFISNGPGALPAQIVQVESSSGGVVYTAKSESPLWLSVTPGSASTSSATPGQSSVSVNTTSLANGVYHGGVSYAIAGQVRTVNVTLIVAAPAVGSPLSEVSGKAASPGCTATEIIPTQTGLVNNFSLPTAWPTPLKISVVDDCGKAVTGGQVVATFSNGDPPLVLPSVGGSAGLYSGTWTPRATASQVTISAQASARGFKPATVPITGQVTRNGAPVLNPGGTLNAFVPVVGSPLAPGMIVQIYGSNLASQVTIGSTIPLLTSLNETSVVIGGSAAPLYYVSPGQINAQVPFELAQGASYQVIVNANGALSTPIPIQLASDAPGIAAFASGGIIAEHGADGSLVTEAAPAAPGEYIVFFVSGMGLTTNPVASGQASPGSPNLAQPIDQATLMLNGANVPVSFAGLTPTLVGLYQVDFQVPANTPNGDLQLVLTQTGGQSNMTVLPVYN